MSARSRLECPPHYTAGRTAAQDDVSFLKFQSNNTVIAVIFHRVLRSVGGRVSNLPLNDLLNWSTDVSISFGAWEEREWLTPLDLLN